jgi:hypothetical protein
MYFYFKFGEPLNILLPDERDFRQATLRQLRVRLNPIDLFQIINKYGLSRAGAKCAPDMIN